MKVGRNQIWITVLCSTLGLGSATLWQSVVAYDPQVSSDLKYSRDALLKQRSELQNACDVKTEQISQLQNDIDRMHAYMKDTDRALSNLDIALRGN